MKIWVVDAFTSEPFRGNPAGVCILDQFPDDNIMQNIAMELNFSNSAFVVRLEPDLFHIRWFTPTSEAPLCGHATIASTHVLMHLGIAKESDTVVFKSLSGEIIVNKTQDFYNLNFPSYKVNPLPFTETLQNVVQFTPLFNGFGENCIFMEFASEDELRNLSPDLTLLTKLSARALIATSKGDNYDFASRYFAPKVGIFEDPVCASAHCRLIPYWSERLGKQEMVAIQASKRGGLLKCKNLGNRVLISGKAITVMECELKISNYVGMRNVA